MERRIIDFDVDEEGHWRAILECGHRRHVRHNPPLVERPWVLSELGRSSRLGTSLDCKRCDDAEAPSVEMIVPATDRLLRNDSFRMRCLRAARDARLTDWYLAAGFLRNAIWDFMHEASQPTPLNDIDLVYFESDDVSTEREAAMERRLSEAVPGVEWQVRNQARMHMRSGHAPYVDTADAIGHWVETPTCVGVRLEDDDALRLVAPYGLEENWELRVRPNPVVAYPRDLYRRRVESKRWMQLWPRLRIMGDTQR